MQMARSNWAWMVVGLLLCSAVHAGAKLNTNFLDAGECEFVSSFGSFFLL